MVLFLLRAPVLSQLPAVLSQLPAAPQLWSQLVPDAQCFLLGCQDTETNFSKLTIHRTILAVPEVFAIKLKVFKRRFDG